VLLQPRKVVAKATRVAQHAERRAFAKGSYHHDTGESSSARQGPPLRRAVDLKSAPGSRFQKTL